MSIRLMPYSSFAVAAASFSAFRSAIAFSNLAHLFEQIVHAHRGHPFVIMFWQKHYNSSAFWSMDRQL
jgi:hypothetical protein